MGIDLKEDKPFHSKSKMNGNPLFILPDHFALDILKEQTTVIARDFYLYRADCPHRKKVITPHKHAANTDIQKISPNTSITISQSQGNVGKKRGAGTHPSFSFLPHFLTPHWWHQFEKQHKRLKKSHWNPFWTFRSRSIQDTIFITPLVNPSFLLTFTRGWP
jgi:hypothetical protein